MPASPSLTARLHWGRGIQPAPTFPRSPGIIHASPISIANDLRRQGLFFQGTDNTVGKSRGESTFLVHNLFTINNL